MKSVWVVTKPSDPRLYTFGTQPEDYAEKAFRRDGYSIFRIELRVAVARRRCADFGEDERNMMLVWAKCPRCGCTIMAEPDDVMPYCDKCSDAVIREMYADEALVPQKKKPLDGGEA